VKLIEIKNVKELPECDLWIITHCSPEEAAAFVEGRTGESVDVVYKFKGRLQYFIPYNKRESWK